MNDTGRMLREARLKRGWSQARLGRSAGLAQSVISAYESGAREPSVAAMRRLARAMDLDLALVPRLQPGPDPRTSARQLEDVLELAETMHLAPPKAPLRYPVLGRPT
ncbi:MAG TPA: helix-turn-helix transcriptional regulator [Acidimicrobiales bacterium]|nr:helix-turn-helix transcriptional regulator [Acidimicrobiales bacterium]